MSQTSARTDSRLAALCAEAARDAFLEYQRHFDEIKQRARDRFLKREWRGSFEDARERLRLYSLILSRLTNHVGDLMTERLNDRWIWIGAKAVYSALIAKFPFPRFLAFPKGAHDELMKRHGNLLRPEFWRDTQRRLRAGKLPDIFPYRTERRLVP